MSLNIRCERMLAGLLLSPVQTETAANAISYRTEKCGLPTAAAQRALETVIALQRAGVLGSETLIPTLLAQLEAQTTMPRKQRQ